MAKRISLQPRLYFSYGQFLVYDKSVAAPGCVWTEAKGSARHGADLVDRHKPTCSRAIRT